MKCSSRHLLAGITLFLLTFAVYLPSKDNTYIWDDAAYHMRAPQLNTLEGLGKIWFNPKTTDQYYPMVHSSYWVEHKLWQGQHRGYHLVNVFLHAFLVFLLWRMLLFLKLPGAWIAAALFALHPMQVESVAWITERKNVLSGCFYMLAALCYLKWYFADIKKRPLYILAFGFFLLALLSKTVTCTLPAALLLIIWWKREKLTKKDFLLVTPFFVVGIGMGLCTAYLEKYHAGAKGEYWEISLVERFLLAGRSLCFYVDKIIWPTDLAFFYPRWQMDDQVWWQYLYSSFVLVLLFILWKFRNTIGRGPLVALLFFAGTLFPALGFFDVIPFRYSYVADHFQYLASIGIIVLICSAFKHVHRPLQVGLSLIALCSLGYLTWQQQAYYKDMETLWRSTIKVYPHWAARTNLGVHLVGAHKDHEGAIEQYQIVLQEHPHLFETRLNLGRSLITLGRLKEAHSHFQYILKNLPSHKPAAYYHLGLINNLNKHYKDAILFFNKAIRSTAENNKSYAGLGYAYANLGQHKKALQHYNTCLTKNSQNKKAHFEISKVYLTIGKKEKAREHLKTLLTLTDNNSRLQQMVKQQLNKIN